MEISALSVFLWDSDLRPDIKEINISTGDEIEELSHAFSQMAHKLKKSIADNEKAADEKRQIAAELSKARSIQDGLLPMAFPESAISNSYEVYSVMQEKSSLRRITSL